MSCIYLIIFGRVLVHLSRLFASCAFFTSDVIALHSNQESIAYSVFFLFSSRLFWTSSSLDVPAGVTQEEGHTGFLIHLPSAVRAFIFLVRRIQPFLLVDREVELSCVLYNDLIVLHLLGIYFYLFIYFSEKNLVYRDRTHVPTCQKVTRLLMSYRGDRLQYTVSLYYYPDSPRALPLLWCICMVINIDYVYYS